MSGLAEGVAELVGRLTHLEGPGVAVLARLVAVAVILLLAFATYRILGHMVDRVLRRATGADEPGRAQRVQTLAPLLNNLALYALSFVVAIVVLQEVGVDVRALAVSAGVLGLAVGFGAQSLIKDVITGFFILFEGLVKVGDVIEVGGHTGVVEAIGLRVTKLRLFNGAQRIVPNGDLTQFANYNRGWARRHQCSTGPRGFGAGWPRVGGRDRAGTRRSAGSGYRPLRRDGGGTATLGQGRSGRARGRGVRPQAPDQGSFRSRWARAGRSPAGHLPQAAGGAGMTRVRKAVFPAAGLGTRFLPATKAQPKEMLPLVDKPTIQYVVEEAVASGLDEIILVTGRNKRAIEDHFDAAFELEYYLQDRGKVEELAQIKTISEMASVSYVRQKEPLGLGHAILCARPLVGDEPFGVFLGDDIIVSRVPCMRQLLDVFERHQGPVLAVMRIPKEEIGRYGVIVPRGVGGGVFEVLDLVEKPEPKDAPSDLAIIGRYVLTPDLFPILADTPPDSRGEIQLTNGLRTLRGRRPIYAIEFEGRRHDTGEKLGFLKATVEIALSRPDLADGFRAYLKTLDL